MKTREEIQALYSSLNKPYRALTVLRTMSNDVTVTKLKLTSDVKRGQNLEAEAKATRPWPRPISGRWGQGQK